MLVRLLLTVRYCLLVTTCATTCYLLLVLLHDPTEPKQALTGANTVAHDCHDSSTLTIAAYPVLPTRTTCYYCVLVRLLLTVRY